MPTGINIYNEAGELVLDNNRKILCSASNPTQETFALVNANMIDYESNFYDASSSAIQPYMDGNAKTMNYVDGDEGAVWVSCSDSTVNFLAYSANILAFYPYKHSQAAKSVVFRHVVTKVPAKVTKDATYIAVYSEEGELCWSAASLIRSVRIIGFIKITDGMLFNKTVLSIDVPAVFSMNDIYVPMFTGISDAVYNVDGGGSSNYLRGIMYKYVGNKVYAKLFDNTLYTTDIAWTGGTRLIPIAYIPYV